MGGTKEDDQEERTLLESRLASHLRCLEEDHTDPEMSPRKQLALVRDRTPRLREIRQTLDNRQRPP